MKLIERPTGKVIGSILTNHSMTLDEAINLLGEIINDMSDERWSDDGDNVIIGDERYWYEDIDMDWDD